MKFQFVYDIYDKISFALAKYGSSRFVFRFFGSLESSRRSCDCCPAVSEPRGARQRENSVRAISKIHRIMNWKIEGKSLVKEFEFADFSQAIEFVNKILPLAEEANHHPDLLVHSYKKVKIMLYTHSENKITDKDHSLAKKIDSI